MAMAIENATTTTTGSRKSKRRASIRHSLASTFSFTSLSALRRHPSLPPTVTATVTATVTVTTPKGPSATIRKPRTTRSPTVERVPIITVDSPPHAQMEDASDEERPWSRRERTRRESRTTINDPRFLALLTMDISRPVFLGSSYSGDLRDLPGNRRDDGGRKQSNAKSAGAGAGAGAGGDASVKEVIDLLERVEREFGIATARVGEGVKDLRDEIMVMKQQRRKVRMKRYEERI